MKKICNSFVINIRSDLKFQSQGKSLTDWTDAGM